MNAAVSYQFLLLAEVAQPGMTMSKCEVLLDVVDKVRTTLNPFSFITDGVTIDLGG